MKIAFITEYRGLGGGETNLLRLTKKLSENHSIGIFCASGLLLDTARNLSHERLEIHKIPPIPRLWRMGLPVPLYRQELLKQLSFYDVIHSYSINALPLLFWAKKPVVWTVHGFWEQPYGIKTRFINRLIYVALPVSSDVENVVEMSKSKTKKVYLGAVYEKDIYPSYKPFDGKNLELCCIGSYQFVKGQDILVDALALLSERRLELNITLWLIGDVNSHHPAHLEFKNSILSRIRSLNKSNLKIMVEGFQGDVSHYIAKSHFVVIPSRYESFSMVAVEALSKGKQVVVPGVGGPMEIVSDPRIGYLYEPGNPEALCRAIIKAVEKYPKDCPQATLERAKMFTVERQALILESIYNSALESHQ